MNKIMKISSKMLITFSMLVMLTVSSISTAQATTILEGANPSLIEAGMENKNGVSITNKNTIQGGGTLSKAENYVDSKLGDVVSFFQSCIKPFTYVMFIISAISILVGIVTGSKHKFAGLLGMAFSILVYVAVTFAPQIVDYFSAWLAI